MKPTTLKNTLAGLALLAPASVMAHTGHEVAGWLSGLSHPLGGLDHLLAMVAVGLWAARLGGRALWAIPAAFVATLLLGGALGMAGVTLPFVEQGIVLSVIALGLLLAGAMRFSVTGCSLIAGGFALFHGLAHGTEMPLAANGLSYAAGLALATVALQGAAMALGRLVLPAKAELLSRVTGGAIALTGLALAAA